MPGPAWDYESPIVGPLGAMDSNGDIYRYMNISWQETELPSTREHWQYGRRLCDGLSFIIGTRVNDNETNWNRNEPYLVHTEGVEYSVLSGPPPFNDNYLYSISSWSQNCPRVDAAGNLTVSSFPAIIKDDIASGCLVDTLLHCLDMFVQDTHSTGVVEDSNQCFLASFSVTLLSSIGRSNHVGSLRWYRISKQWYKY